MHSCVQVAGRAAWPAGYPDVAATVLADDGHSIIRLYALGHQVGLQLDDLFFGISVARIRFDAKTGDVISAPRRMANLTLVEVDLMVIKESVQQLADKFGFGSRRVRVAVVSDAAVHPSHQSLLCSLSRVHLRVDAGHAEGGPLRVGAKPTHPRGECGGRAGRNPKIPG